MWTQSFQAIRAHQPNADVNQSDWLIAFSVSFASITNCFYSASAILEAPNFVRWRLFFKLPMTDKMDNCYFEHGETCCVLLLTARTALIVLDGLIMMFETFLVWYFCGFQMGIWNDRKEISFQLFNDCSSGFITPLEVNSDDLSNF